MSKKNTQASLQKLSQPKLVDLYKKTLGDAAKEEATPEEMIAAILAAETDNGEEGEESDTGTMKFGNMDKDKKHDISKLKVPANHYVVRHFSNVKLQNGQEMEDPTSSRIQVYDKETFDNYSRQGVKDNKQTPSTFEKLGLNVDVLHDPTK